MRDNDLKGRETQAPAFHALQEANGACGCIARRRERRTPCLRALFVECLKIARADVDLSTDSDALPDPCKKL
jgi:hypothetical protein